MRCGLCYYRHFSAIPGCADGSSGWADRTPLIAQDVRSRAFLLYFSRPLTRMEYILGKAAIVSTYVVMITTFGVAVYVLWMYCAGSYVIADTWTFRYVIYGISCGLFPPLPLAAISSMTRTRYASFTWFVFGIGWVAYPCWSRYIATLDQ